jgi:hypothetical protein
MQNEQNIVEEKRRKKEEQEEEEEKKREKEEQEKREKEENKKREQQEQEQLYEKLNTAILDEQYSTMVDILQQPGYEPDEVGGEDAQTALHVAVQCEYVEAIDILLKQINVDCNVRDSNGLSPLMLAASKVKIEALERLLEDPRVNIKLRTKKNENALDLLPDKALPFQRMRAMNLFQAAAKTRNSKESQKRRVAVIIANSDYEESSGLSTLPGAMEDLERLTAFLEEKTYHIVTIVNARDIVAEVTEVMEGLPDSCLPVTHFQLVYSGNGP